MYTLAIALLLSSSPVVDQPAAFFSPVTVATDSTDRSARSKAESTTRLPNPLRVNRKLNNRRSDIPRSQRSTVIGKVFSRARPLSPRQYNPKLRAHRQRVHRLKQRRYRKHALRNYRIP